jgi:hypothetical protein
LALIYPLGVDNLCSMGKFNLMKTAWLIILLALPNTPGVLQAQVIESGQAFSAPKTEPAKVTVGIVEDIILSPWGVSFPARIDTGADLSSLDARDIVVRNNIADFKLGKRYGALRLQLPVIEWRHIQTATGTEKRPVVEISICLGSKHFHTLATLKDRSEMMYPFLVGRSALSGNFLVDPSRSKAAQPSCSNPPLELSDLASSVKE